MRISEKSFELNFCADFSRHSPYRVFWFGLTQKDEAKRGYDFATRSHGITIFFQMKAPKCILGNGDFRFYAQHHQLQSLQKITSSFGKRSIFYVFPLIKDTAEIRGSSILIKCWLLDVKKLSNPFPNPTNRNGDSRKSGLHHIDVSPGAALIHSIPQIATLDHANSFFSTTKYEEREQNISITTDGIKLPAHFEIFWDFCRSFTDRALGAVIENT